jgi:hypothetical protein
LLFLTSGILPVFYLALYRNHAVLCIPRRMMLLSRAAAFVLALFVLAALWTEFLDPGFTARGGVSDGQARAIGHIVSLLNMSSNATLALLLVSFNLAADEESVPEAPVSRFLEQATRVAVVFSGLVLAGSAIRCLLTPYTYSGLKDVAIQNGRTLPPFSALLEEAVRTLVLQACAFTAPLIVFMRETHSATLAASR